MESNIQSRKHNHSSAEPSKLSKKQKVTIGKVSGSFWRKEELTEGELNHHVHIVGASGYGKSVLISQIIKQRIQQGKGVLFIDLKGDLETVFKYSNYAAEVDRAGDVHVFSLSNQEISLPYNLVADGTPTQLRDRILMSLNWTEEYYKNQASSYLLKILIGLCFLRENQKFQFHLGTILKTLKSYEFVEELCKKIPDTEEHVKEMVRECCQTLNSPEHFKSLQGIRTQIESLVYSDFGRNIATSYPGINLFDIVTQGKIVFLFLDSRRYGEAAKSVGRFILQDLKAVSARIDSYIPKNERKPFTVIIDEFADFAQEDFIAFQDRARSANMGIIVAHQEISDLQRVSTEFARRLMGNSSTLYAFLQKDSQSAEMISGMAGTRRVLKKTDQTERFLFMDLPTGKKSLREVEEFNIHPNLVKSLQVGKCVCIKKYPYSRAYLVKVNP